MNLSRCFALLASVSIGLVAAPAPEATSSSRSVSVYWTAPGDDSLLGRATAYDLRYSIAPLTSTNFNLATRITGLPAPAIAGTAESFVISGLPDSTFYYLAIKTADEAGNWSVLSNIATLPWQTTHGESSELALAFSSPWPNPARQSVRWWFALPRAGWIQVDIFDVMGRHVHSVANGLREAGRGELSWDLRDDQGRRVDAGLYFAKVRIGTAEWTKRVVVVR